MTIVLFFHHPFYSGSKTLKWQWMPCSCNSNFLGKQLVPNMMQNVLLIILPGMVDCQLFPTSNSMVNGRFLSLCCRLQGEIIIQWWHPCIKVSQHDLHWMVFFDIAHICGLIDFTKIWLIFQSPQLWDGKIRLWTTYSDNHIPPRICVIRTSPTRYEKEISIRMVAKKDFY